MVVSDDWLTAVAKAGATSMPTEDFDRWSMVLVLLVAFGAIAARILTLRGDVISQGRDTSTLEFDGISPQ